MCVLCGPDGAEAVVDHSITHPFELKPDSDYECQMCDQHVSAHPDKMEFLKKHEMETIIRAGHQVRYVFGEDTAFSYSIGRCVKDWPELLVTGALRPEVHQYMINRVAELDAERHFQGGEQVDEVLDGYPVRLVRVRDLEAAEMYGVTDQFGTDDTWALQILWPDEDGRFPGEEGFGYPPEAQPLFA